MKVVCLKTHSHNEVGDNLLYSIIEGNVYTVVSCQMVEGIPCYLFKELP